MTDYILSRPRLLDQVRELIRLKHYSIRTKEAYVRWIKKYIFPNLAVNRNVATPTH
ncbi:MAG TPA: phage integrase N-terminal SAM-like domain-containing protein [Blastocatellia bacterium]|nr:phage integrase N-terminal SAM-like domain-containing protein [Blastocatellia bacterium]